MTTAINITGPYTRPAMLLSATLVFFLCLAPEAEAIKPIAKPLTTQSVDNSKSEVLRTHNKPINISRTKHGVVHVNASGYEDLGFGVAYSYTQDNRCLLAYRIAEVNGRLSQQLGPNAPVRSEVHDITYTSLQSDHYYRGWFNINDIRTGFDTGAPEVRQLAVGYAQGVNRFINLKKSVQFKVIICTT